MDTSRIALQIIGTVYDDWEESYTPVVKTVELKGESWEDISKDIERLYNKKVDNENYQTFLITNINQAKHEQRSLKGKITALKTKRMQVNSLVDELGYSAESTELVNNINDDIKQKEDEITRFKEMQNKLQKTFDEIKSDSSLPDNTSIYGSFQNWLNSESGSEFTYQYLLSHDWKEVPPLGVAVNNIDMDA